jgi:hypothetical protein
MIKTSVELMAEVIGFDIANSDDHTQANLLNGLGKGFSTYQERDFNMQLAYVSNKLTPQAKSFIKTLAEYVNIKD